MNIIFHDGTGMDALGAIPSWLNEDDPRSATKQLDAHYSHGGGWDPFYGFVLLDDDSIQYPGDPPHRPLAEILFRNERVIFFDHSWVMVMQPDRSFEICRMD